MRLARLSVPAALACVFVLSGVAVAQTISTPPPASSDPDTTSVEDVSVVGVATRRSMETYARAIGSGPMGRLSPRWNDRVCIRVVNMDAEHATWLRDRVATDRASGG